MNSKLKKALFFIITLVIILIISTIVYDYLKTKYHVEEILEEEYLISVQDEKVGVTDKERKYSYSATVFRNTNPKSFKSNICLFL